MHWSEITLSVIEDLDTNLYTLEIYGVQIKIAVETDAEFDRVRRQLQQLPETYGNTDDDKEGNNLASLLNFD